MAHAGYGHNAFFKSNYLFRQFTQPDAILDYLKFARGFRAGVRGALRLARSREDPGQLPRAIGLRRGPLPAAEPTVAAARARAGARTAALCRAALQAGLRPPGCACAEPRGSGRYRGGGLRAAGKPAVFHPKRAHPSWRPGSANWCGSCARLAQYFYPQRLTKVANEGAATFWHYTLLHELYDAGEVGRRLHAGVAVEPQRRGCATCI